jgi:hypothetical protein
MSRIDVNIINSCYECEYKMEKGNKLEDVCIQCNEKPLDLAPGQPFATFCPLLKYKAKEEDDCYLCHMNHLGVEAIKEYIDEEVHMYRNLQYDAAHKNTPMDNYDEMRAKIAIEVLEDFKEKMFPQNI